MTSQNTSNRSASRPVFTALRLLWLAFAILALGIFLMGVPIQVNRLAQAYQAPEPLPFGFAASTYAWIATCLDVLFILVYFLFAFFINLRARQDLFAILAAFALIVIPIRVPPELRQLASYSPAWAWMRLLLPALGYTFVPLFLSLFPNGHWYPRWIWIYPTAGLVFSILIVSGLTNYPSISYTMSLLLDISVVGAGVVAQILRYRRAANSVERLQTRWALFGITTAFFGYYLFNFIYNYRIVQNTFLIFQTSPAANYLYNLFARLWYPALLLIPLTLAISILRYRLWDIDLIIRRTLVYTLLSVTLAGVYFGTVVLLQAIFRLITAESSGLVITISTLAIAFLFAPLRRLLQDFIDRRFYRRRYDAEQILSVFAAAVRNEVDLDHLTAELLYVVDETMQPDSLSLWLKGRAPGGQSLLPLHMDKKLPGG